MIFDMPAPMLQADSTQSSRRPATRLHLVDRIGVLTEVGCHRARCVRAVGLPRAAMSIDPDILICGLVSGAKAPFESSRTFACRLVRPGGTERPQTGRPAQVHRGCTLSHESCEATLGSLYRGLHAVGICAVGLFHAED